MRPQIEIPKDEHVSLNQIKIPRDDREEYVSLKQLPGRYPAFSESSLRWLRFNGSENGFNRCVRKVGKKIVISIRDFEAWLETKAS